ncbi:MAG: nucleoside triphosphate pyrophosphohydrolase [Candidatus Obscuribacterales bacterium]|nr:nucleoside triphosphate pyrophosphohydrolase [Candidatus Obscuribacterales bacterium]
MSNSSNPITQNEQSSAIDAFVKTIATLRGPDGCPWDKEQTHSSLGRYLLEESYEVLEAIHEGDPKKLREELGDLLLQIVLNAQVAKDAGNFDFNDVAADINEKMISRHPHVFGDAKAENADAVLKQWDELKEAEKKSGTQSQDEPESALAGIQKTLPALLQALKISEKAVSKGFEWNHESEIWEQLESEIKELKEALAEPNFSKHRRDEKEFRDVELEFGDVLFTVVNLARWHTINPEETLILAIEKFKKRFGAMEKMRTKPLKELSSSEYQLLWDEAKKLNL